MVTLNITNGPSFQVPWVKGMNAQNVMEAAFNSQGTPRTFTYMLQYYGSGLGYLVDMINGTFDTALSSDAPYFFGILLWITIIQIPALIVRRLMMGKPLLFPTRSTMLLRIATPFLEKNTMLNQHSLAS